MSAAQTITIAETEFKCSRASARKLRRALRMGKILRLYKRYDADVAEVCRDLLMERATGKAHYLGTRQVDEVVALIVPAKPFEPVPLLHAAKTNSLLGLQKTLSFVIRQRETGMKIILVVMAVALAWSTIWSTDGWVQMGTPHRYQADFYGTLQDSVLRPSATVFLAQQAMALCLVVLCLVAIRYKKLRLAVPLGILVALLATNLLSAVATQPVGESYAEACGDYILTEASTGQDPSAFSVLSPHWKLATPIPENRSLDTSQNCDTYLAVRKTHPDAKVVIASYIVTDAGNIRSFDYNLDSPAGIQYGFFVPD